MTDEACVILATLTISCDAFNEYQCDYKFSMGLNLGILEKILNCAYDDVDKSLRSR